MKKSKPIKERKGSLKYFEVDISDFNRYERRWINYWEEQFEYLDDNFEMWY